MSYIDPNTLFDLDGKPTAKGFDVRKRMNMTYPIEGDWIAGEEARKLGYKFIDIKLHERNTEAIIAQTESNEELARSNEKYQKALNRLTGGLVFVGLIQIVVQFLKK